MGVPTFLFRQFRAAPSKRRFIRALKLGNDGGDRIVTSGDGTSLSVRCSGSGTPLVLVHGTLDGMGAFATVEVELAEHFQVWTYDRRGRGGSGDTEPHTLDSEVDDLRAVVTATGSTPHVVAHSFGALIALRAAVDGVGMRSLTVYEPPTNGDAIAPGEADAIRDLVAGGHLDDAIGRMARNLAGITDDELGIAMKVPPERARLRDGVRTAPREIDAVRTCDWSGLPLDGVPVLAVRGERSDAAAYPTAEQAARLATDVEIATLPGQGHLGNVFAPWTFTDIVRSFVERH